MRYFYTCPIEAAYMAKNFSMKFLKPSIKNVGGKIVPCEWPANDWETDFFCSSQSDCDWESGPFYIHHDSLPIFEPQEGDSGITGGELLVNFTDGDWCILLPDGYQGLDDDIQVKIIQRQGKAFIMPEVEA
jgi:hypothetical protein